MRKVDFPALGNPTKPTSASDFNSNLNDRISPLKPGVDFLGALFVEDLNLAFPCPPSPPLAIKYSFVSSTQSNNSSLVTSSYMTVPFGTLMIRSSPADPDLFLPEPLSPFFASNIFLFWKSISVLEFGFTLNKTSPPLPPSPPSGPPNGIYFSLLKLDAPEPPSPALTSR